MAWALSGPAGGTLRPARRSGPRFAVFPFGTGNFASKSPEMSPCRSQKLPTCPVRTDVGNRCGASRRPYRRAPRAIQEGDRACEVRSHVPSCRAFTGHGSCGQAGCDGADHCRRPPHPPDRPGAGRGGLRGGDALRIRPSRGRPAPACSSARETAITTRRSRQGTHVSLAAPPTSPMPCRAQPGPTQPCPTAPCPTTPCRAMPRRAQPRLTATGATGGAGCAAARGLGHLPAPQSAQIWGASPPGRCARPRDVATREYLPH